MEVITGNNLAVNGKVPVHVEISDDSDYGPNESIQARVWVDDVDSQGVLYASAERAAIPLLKRALAALEQKVDE